MKTSELAERLRDRGVPVATIEVQKRLNYFDLTPGRGSGYYGEYDHTLEEALAVFWHPFFWNEPGSNKLRRLVLDIVRDLPCEPRLLVISERRVRVADVADLSLSMFEKGAAVIPVHMECEHD